MLTVLTKVHRNLTLKAEVSLDKFSPRYLSFPEEQIDFYLPQLINMYINMPSVAEVLHPDLVARCR